MMETRDNKKWELGCRLPIEDWRWLNTEGIFKDPSLRPYAAPFPPKELMQIVSGGLSRDEYFAYHGADIFEAVTRAAGRPLTEYRHILDFGCGVGRLARMFKGHPHAISGCDIDERHVLWVNENLDFVKAVKTEPKPPLPFPDNSFDAVIAISVFTHLNEPDQDRFLKELHRVTQPEGSLFLTIHGTRALERALEEEPIFKMLEIPETSLKLAKKEFYKGKLAFISQRYPVSEGQKTRQDASGILARLKQWILRGKDSPDEDIFDYGITFTPESYVADHWARWFEVIEQRQTLIHDFQNIIALKPRKKRRHSL